MVINDQGILICETCQQKLVMGLGLDGDRICPALEQVGHCPDLGLTYSKPEKSKSTRTGEETKNYGT